MARRKIPYFSLMVDKDKFFDKLQVGDVFTYSDGYCLDEVKKMARRRGVTLLYCPPKSEEYIKHGCMTVKVAEHLINEPESQPFHFDPVFLDT